MQPVERLTPAGRAGDRIPMQWGARFSAPIQIGPGVRPALGTRDTDSLAWE